jgi:hypothetical protein
VVSSLGRVGPSPIGTDPVQPNFWVSPCPYVMRRIVVNCSEKQSILLSRCGFGNINKCYVVV